MTEKLISEEPVPAGEEKGAPVTAPLAPVPVTQSTPTRASVAQKAPVKQGAECWVNLEVAKLAVRSSCWTDESTNKSGRLTYPCAGGAASARFGSDNYRGTVDGERFVLSRSTQFSWDDGCKWETVQKITGDIRTKRGSFSYKERPLSGQKNCANPCNANASVTVHVPH